MLYQKLFFLKTAFLVTKHQHRNKNSQILQCLKLDIKHLNLKVCDAIILCQIQEQGVNEAKIRDKNCETDSAKANQLKKQ